MTTTDEFVTDQVQSRLHSCPICFARPRVLVHATSVEIVCHVRRCRDVMGRTMEDAIALWNEIKRP